MVFSRILPLLGLCLGVAASCQTSKNAAPQNTTFGTCAPELSVVRTVTDVQAVVHFDQQLKQYRLDAHQPNTTDAVDLGVVCGALPPAYQVEGRKVVFSGTYKTYPTPPSAPGGYTFYHLELTKLQAN